MVAMARWLWAASGAVAVLALVMGLLPSENNATNNRGGAAGFGGAAHQMRSTVVHELESRLPFLVEAGAWVASWPKVVASAATHVSVFIRQGRERARKASAGGAAAGLPVHWREAVRSVQPVPVHPWDYNSIPRGADYIASERQPMVLTNSPAMKWAAQNWSMEYLRAAAVESTATVSMGASGRDPAVVLEKVRLSEQPDFLHFPYGVSVKQMRAQATAALGPQHGQQWRPAYHFSKVKAPRFFDIIQGNDTFIRRRANEKYALYTEMLRRGTEEPSGVSTQDVFLRYLSKDIPHEAVEDFSLTREGRLVAPDITLWMGGAAGVTSNAHYDAVHNFFVQITGSKRFVLFPPWQHHLLYLYPKLHPNSFKSQINMDRVDLQAFPAFALAEAWEVVLQPGDVLYIPPYWIHYVTALSTSVSLTLWTDAEECEHTDHIHDVPLPFEHDWDVLLMRRAAAAYLSMVIGYSFMDAPLVVLGEEQQTQTNAQEIIFSRLKSSRYRRYELQKRTSRDALLPACDYHLLPNELFEKLDSRAAKVAELFRRLPRGVKDLKLADYIEEVSHLAITHGQTAADRKAASVAPWVQNLAYKCPTPTARARGTEDGWTKEEWPAFLLALTESRLEQ